MTLAKARPSETRSPNNIDSVQIQLAVEAPDGSIEGIIVGYNGDAKGIYKGSVVTVWATVVDTASFTSETGGLITQPLLDAKYIENADGSSMNSDASSKSADGYTVLTDVRDLVAHTGQMKGKKVSVQGTVVAVFDTGEAGYLGDANPRPYTAQLQIAVMTPDGSYEGIIIGYNGDTAGIFKGSIVTVAGTIVDTQSFTSTQGGAITQPLIAADRISIDQS